MEVIESMQKITAPLARHIRLGSESRWVGIAIEQGELHLWYDSIPHELCQHGEWDEVNALFRAQGRTLQSASDATRELCDFYSMGPDCLWITFWDKRLWWAFSEPDVTWLGPANDRRGSRMRKTIGPWRCADILNRTLLFDELSTRLTQVRDYPRTLCDVIEKETTCCAA